MNKIELLAPAGNFEALAAAVESGADAVYLGGNKFNARAYADNFDGEALERAVNYAHIRGAKVYITLNILLSDSELAEALDYAGFLYKIGADAVIVQDIALLKLIRSAFPGMNIHCSTQMTVHNTEGAKYYASLGAKRIVTARELSLEEIRGIAENSGVEIEVFVHGALCVSYSGQCLLSSLIGGRSGNRGRCAQPCRRKYSLYNFNTGRTEGQCGYLLSTRDLNTYGRLKELASSGVASLKIEGRMKKAEYVAIVVKHYRDALDSIAGKDAVISPEAGYELKSAFNREFTEGYMFNNRNRDIVSIERPDNRGVMLGKVLGQKGDMASIVIKDGCLNDGDGIEIISPKGRSTGTVISGIRVKGRNVKRAEKGDIAEIFVRDRVEAGSRVNKTFDSVLNRKAREEYSFENRKKIRVECKLIMKSGENPVIIVRDSDGNAVSYTGEEKVEPAVKAATPAGKVLEQLGKTGDTPYIIEVKDAVIEDNCYIPVRQVNRMRREVLEELSRKRAQVNDRPTPRVNAASEIEKMLAEKGAVKKALPEYIAAVRNRETALSALDSGADTVYLLGGVYEGDLAADSVMLAGICAGMGKGLFYVFPNIVRDREMARLENELEKIIAKAGLPHFGLVISEAGQLELARRLNAGRLRTSYSLNIFNSVAADHMHREGAEAVGLSPELTLGSIRAISSGCAASVEALVYGYLPVMTTEYCPVSVVKNCCGNRVGCFNSNYGIIDEKRKIFRMIRLDSCRIQLLNSDVLFLSEELDAIIDSGVSGLRMDFYIESPEEAGRIIRLYRNHGKMDESDRQLLEKIKSEGFTKGHFYRGVD